MAGPKNKKQMSLWATIGLLLLTAALYAFEHWQKNNDGPKRTDDERAKRDAPERTRDDADRPRRPIRGDPERTPKKSAPRSTTTARTEPDNRAIERMWRQRAHEKWVEGASIVVKVLPDDNEGSRHQRFLIRISRNVRVKVAHNIDLAPRLPVKAGDVVAYRGKYVYNDLGGALHWTHHDPRGRHKGGWLRHKGKTYK